MNELSPMNEPSPMCETGSSVELAAGVFSGRSGLS